MLVVGIIMIQWPRSSDLTLPSITGEGSGELALGFDADQFKGFIAVICACFTSGFAGVYIQKMLQQTTASIWMRNVQFGLFGTAMAKDGEAIVDAGLMQGYTGRVVLVVLMNALGGLLCAAMLKYAGATLGCFSTALSIILTCVLSATVLQDFVPDLTFVLGSALAVSASILYGLGLPESCLNLVRYLRPPTQQLPGQQQDVKTQWLPPPAVRSRRTATVVPPLSEASGGSQNWEGEGRSDALPE